MNHPLGYTIRLEVYEGPLDLLLELIEQAELDITKVALAQVTDQYLTYLNQLQDRDAEELTAFLVIASRLLQIKSEALLPRPPQREPGEEDPGDALARQLIAYKKYKQVAVFLSQRAEQGLRTYIRLSATPSLEPSVDLSGIGLEALQEAMLTVLAALQPAHAAEPPIEGPVVRIRDKVKSILAVLSKDGSLSFTDMIRKAKSRLEIVVSFLALLELIKLHQVDVRQERVFEDITVSPGRDWRADQSEALELEFEE